MVTAEEDDREAFSSHCSKTLQQIRSNDSSRLSEWVGPDAEEENGPGTFKPSAISDEEDSDADDEESDMDDTSSGTDDASANEKAKSGYEGRVAGSAPPTPVHGGIIQPVSGKAEHKADQKRVDLQSVAVIFTGEDPSAKSNKGKRCTVM